MVGALEVFAGVAAEVGELHGHRDVVLLDVGEPQPDLGAVGALGLDVPLAALAPAEADRAGRYHDLAAQLVDADGLPFRVVVLAEPALEVGGADEGARNIRLAALLEPDQERHVGVAPTVVLEVGHLPLDVELLEDDVPERHRERGIGAGLRVQPEVGELGRLAVVGRDHDALRALVADLGVEMGVGRSRLRHVRAP